VGLFLFQHFATPLHTQPRPHHGGGEMWGWVTAAAWYGKAVTVVKQQQLNTLNLIHLIISIT
jgi:hypothetical protein